MRVLLIEDDRDLAVVVGKGLRQAHLAVDASTSLGDATERLIHFRYDLVCLDLGLPDGDGLQLCRHVRGDPELYGRPRILILTARDAVEERVHGLDAGADDYLIKPFALAELMARVRALTRRGEHDGNRVHVGDLDVDTVGLRAYRAGRDLQLTAKEYAVLRYLAMHIEEVVSAEELMDHCWDANVNEFSSTVRVILSRLRRKLGPPALIRTVPNVGYVLGGV